MQMVGLDVDTRGYFIAGTSVIAIPTGMATYGINPSIYSTSTGINL